MRYTLPELAYDYSALGKSISSDIMRLHHDKHHQTYVDKLNAALETRPGLSNLSLVELISSIDSLGDLKLSNAIRNHGGGHYNHSEFWLWMTPNGGGEPSGNLATELAEKYGSFQAFVDEFTTKSLAVFGSGWVWLQPDLSIVTTANQDNPLMSGSDAPILGLDVWEHAYYLDYKNKRDDYVAAWWDVVNWDYVSQLYSK